MFAFYTGRMYWTWSGDWVVFVSHPLSPPIAGQMRQKRIVDRLEKSLWLSTGRPIGASSKWKVASLCRHFGLNVWHGSATDAVSVSPVWSLSSAGQAVTYYEKAVTCSVLRKPSIKKITHIWDIFFKVGLSQRYDFYELDSFFHFCDSQNSVQTKSKERPSPAEGANSLRHCHPLFGHAGRRDSQICCQCQTK